MPRSRSTNRDGRRRGIAVVFTAISIVTLLLFASLAVDVGWICTLAAEMQNTADAGALAGAIALQRGHHDDARPHALRIIAHNQKRLGFSSLEDQRVQLGRWDPVTHHFTPLEPVDWDKAYAVRVRAVRRHAPLFFSALIGRNSTTVWRKAVAVGSRPCEGIWGLNGVRVPGSVVTDSYDSTERPYSELTARDNGDVCSGRSVRACLVRWRLTGT